MFENPNNIATKEMSLLLVLFFYFHITTVGSSLYNPKTLISYLNVSHIKKSAGESFNKLMQFKHKW